MYTRSVIVRGVVCAMALAIASVVSTAGPLSPPVGPIAATGRFGPRIEVNAMNTPGSATSLFVISQPGSYYVGGNITGVAAKNGIEIASSGVTLDLMGFDLSGVTGSLDGITVSAVGTSAVSIHNGTVRNWEGSGINAMNALNSLLRNLRVERNSANGLSIGNGGIVEYCSVQRNGNDGILAIASVEIRENTLTINFGDGIEVNTTCLVFNNTCIANGFLSSIGAGVHVTGSDNRIEGNNVISNDSGIDVDSSGNLIIRNSASGNGVNYDIIGTQTIGPIITATGTIASNNPWANFSY